MSPPFRVSLLVSAAVLFRVAAYSPQNELGDPELFIHVAHIDGVQLIRQYGSSLYT